MSNRSHTRYAAPAPVQRDRTRTAEARALSITKRAAHAERVRTSAPLDTVRLMAELSAQAVAR